MEFGYSCRSIAVELGLSVSKISREVNRHSRKVRWRSRTGYHADASQDEVRRKLSIARAPRTLIVGGALWNEVLDHPR